LIVLNIRAGGTGIDGLQHAASHVAFLELGWTPAEHIQAEDRLSRIGQKSAVNVWYLLAEDTIDEWLFELIQAKEEIVTEAADGTVDRARRLNITRKLLRKLKEAA
jgi:SWI/SNF-related matrix-associated actin-dependent regulator 1 of chromatin subfamily A